MSELESVEHPDYAAGGLLPAPDTTKVTLLPGELVLTADGRILKWTGETFVRVPGNWREWEVE